MDKKFDALFAVHSNINMNHIKGDAIVCTRATEYVSCKKIFNDAATESFNALFFENFGEISKWLSLFNKELNTFKWYLKGGNVIHYFFYKHRAHKGLTLESFRKLVQNEIDAQSYYNAFVNAFALSDIDIGIQLSDETVLDEIKYRNATKAIAEAVDNIKTQLNYIHRGENAFVRNRLKYNEKINGIVPQVIAKLNKLPRTKEVYNGGTGSSQLFLLNVDNTITPLPPKILPLSITLKKENYDPKNIKLTTNQDLILLRENENILTFRTPGGPNNVYSSIYNNCLAFAHQKYQVIFDLFRVRLNFLHDDPPENKFIFYSEVLDVSITHPYDVMSIVLKKYDMTKKTYPIIKSNGISGTFEFHAVGNISILIDLECILFMKHAFPWMDKKYDKRIIRLAFFTMYEPSLIDEFRGIIEIIIKILMMMKYLSFGEDKLPHIDPILNKIKPFITWYNSVYSHDLDIEKVDEQNMMFDRTDPDGISIYDSFQIPFKIIFNKLPKFLIFGYFVYIGKRDIKILSDTPLDDFRKNYIDFIQKVFNIYVMFLYMSSISAGGKTEVDVQHMAKVPIISHDASSKDAYLALSEYQEKQTTETLDYDTIQYIVDSTYDEIKANKVIIIDEKPYDVDAFD